MWKTEKIGWHKGFKYTVVLTSLGHRCGYVAVPLSHPWYAERYSEVPANCHGGLTYSEPGKNKTYPMDQFDDVWWVGFDCAHYNDDIDTEAMEKYFVNPYKGYKNPGGIVRSEEFVTEECHCLIDSAIEAEEDYKTILENKKEVAEGLLKLGAYCCLNNDNPLYVGGPTGGEYIAGIVRVDVNGNNRGSYVEGLDTYEKTIKFINSLDWEEITVPDNIMHDNSRYFQAPIKTNWSCVEDDETVAWQNIAPLKILDRNKVFIGHREHGQELCTYTEDIGKIRTNTISLIMDKDGMVVTWYPGCFTANSPNEIPQEPADWDGEWAVKLLVKPVNID